MKSTTSTARRLLFAAAALIGTAGASAATLAVGPGKTYPAPCAAIAAAKDGDTIEIEGNTTYMGDVCSIKRNGLTIRGVNGRPKIDANGKISGDKAIWVVNGNDLTVDNVEMYGSATSLSGNGAAFRLEAKNFTLRNSFLHDNQNGILSNAVIDSDILIEYTEFGHNGFGDGQTHNLYIGRAKSLTFRYNFSHDANVGHNLKSRANVNTITYNRFSSLNPNEFGTTAPGQPSYEIDLPNAGTAYIIGNIIQQPALNQNGAMVAFGAEGATNPTQDLYVVNNTFVNDSANGALALFISGKVTTTALVQNNLFAGVNTLYSRTDVTQKSNLQIASPGFVNRAAYDLHPDGISAAINAGTDPGVSAAGFPLAPTAQYKHLAAGEARPQVGALDIGAYEVTSAAATTPTVWAACAAEKATCTFNGTREVRFGAGSSYSYKTVTGSVPCTTATFGDPAANTVKSCAYSSVSTPAVALPATTAPATPTWTLCSPENNTCSFWGTREVRFGVEGKYSTKVFTNLTRCSNDAFGSDPAPNTVKSCSFSSVTIAPAATPGTPVTPVPTPSTPAPTTSAADTRADALGAALSALLGRTVTVTIK